MAFFSNVFNVFYDPLLKIFNLSSFHLSFQKRLFWKNVVVVSYSHFRCISWSHYFLRLNQSQHGKFTHKKLQITIFSRVRIQAKLLLHIITEHYVFRIIMVSPQTKAKSSVACMAPVILYVCTFVDWYAFHKAKLWGSTGRLELTLTMNFMRNKKWL